MAPPVETPYGQSVNPEDAPAAISQAVASLPPEQMYSLMKDMKEVIMVSNHLNRATPSQWSFRPNSARGSIETHSTLSFLVSRLYKMKFRIIQLRPEICYYKILNSHMLCYRPKW